MAPQLVGRNSQSGGSLWTGIRRELGELFIFRPAGTQSPRASERIDRARRYLAGGQADKAIEEVEAMPGAEVASEWLIDARRYHEARRALDLRSEEHTSELQSLMRISYAVFCLKKKT